MSECEYNIHGNIIPWLSYLFMLWKWAKHTAKRLLYIQQRVMSFGPVRVLRQNANMARLNGKQKKLFPYVSPPFPLSIIKNNSPNKTTDRWWVQKALNHSKSSVLPRHAVRCACNCPDCANDATSNTQSKLSAPVTADSSGLG